MIGISLVLFVTVPAADPPKSKWPLGKETTYVTGPLDKEGFIDYEAALNERMSKGITPNTNANVLIWKAIGPRPAGDDGMPPEYFTVLGVAAPPEAGEYFIGLKDFLKDRLKLDEAESDAVTDRQIRVSARRPWRADDYPHIAAWLSVNEKPLAAVTEAAKRPAYFNPLIAPRTATGRGLLLGARLASVQTCRDLTVALAARAMLRVGAGRPDDAWQDLLACHRLARLVSRGGTLIESLVGFAMDQIASTADLAYLDRAPLTAQQIRDRLTTSAASRRSAPRPTRWTSALA